MDRRKIWLRSKISQNLLPCAPSMILTSRTLHTLSISSTISLLSLESKSPTSSRTTTRIEPSSRSALTSKTSFTTASLLSDHSQILTVCRQFLKTKLSRESWGSACTEWELSSSWDSYVSLFSRQLVSKTPHTSLLSWGERSLRQSFTVSRITHSAPQHTSKVSLCLTTWRIFWMIKIRWL